MKGVSRVVDPYGPYKWKRPLSIRTRSENCISLRYIRRLTRAKGVSRVVDPYGPYRWNRPFSIRIQSENWILLSGLECISLLTGVRWGSQVVDPYGPYRWNKPFSIRHDRKTLLKNIKGSSRSHQMYKSQWPMHYFFCLSLKNYTVLIEPYCNTNTPKAYVVQHWNKWNDTWLSSSIETGLFRLMSCLPGVISLEMSVDSPELWSSFARGQK